VRIGIGADCDDSRGTDDTSLVKHYLCSRVQPAGAATQAVSPAHHTIMAQAIVAAQSPLIHWRTFMHSAGNWDTARPMSLWKQVGEDGHERRLVSFDGKVMHGNWSITEDNNGAIAILSITFHWDANEAKASWHFFEPIANTDGFHAGFKQWHQVLLPARHTIMAQSIAAAQGPWIHWRTFMHKAGNWDVTRRMSLWTMVGEDGKERRFVSFDGKAMHGNWSITVDKNGAIEVLNIKFHWHADEAQAGWHFFKPIANTDGFHAGRNEWHQVLLPEKNVIEVF